MQYKSFAGQSKIVGKTLSVRHKTARCINTNPVEAMAFTLAENLAQASALPFTFASYKFSPYLKNGAAPQR